MTTSPVAYFNGEFMFLDAVHISPLDRGFLFADGVYEVVPAYNGQLFRLEPHVQRLRRSLEAIHLAVEHDWAQVMTDLVARNAGGEQYVYLQVTRGAPAVRDHGFPAEPVPATVFAMAKPLKQPSEKVLNEGLSAITVPDIRWQFCHIKSVALLANVLARQQAIAEGADDAIMIRDGVLTEASAGNFYLVRDGEIYTPPADWRILHGITRSVVLELARANGIPCHEVELPVVRLASADEVWISSSTKDVLPITRVDGRPVGSGQPGPVWQRLWSLFQNHKREVCGSAW